MPYAIRLPDGTLVQNIPDDLAPEEAKRRIIAAGLVSQPAPPETTFLGQTKEAFKGLIPGAVGLVESAAIGASALLPEEQERAAREAIARIAGAAKAPFAPAPGYEQTVGRKIGEAVGSTGPFLAAGPLGWAGRLGAVGLGVGAGAGEARTRAEAEGATAEQRGTATALGTIPGALEIFAPFRILSRIPEGEVLTAATKVKRVLQAAGEEAAQEAASGLAQNMIARGVYKPDQALIEGLGEQAAYGGATGAIVQGLMDLALGRRARGAGAGAPAEGQPGELPVERLRREQAQEIATRAEAKREPINRAQTVIDETLAQPITEAYPRLTQEIETLKQQPESKERNAAIRELEAERARRQREDTERARAGKKVAEGFLTAEEAAAQGVTPREEFDPTEARREEIVRLRAQREGMLVKGKPPAPKSPARRGFDELDARLVEIGGGRWTPTLPPPTATEPTTPTVEVGAPAAGLTEQALLDLGLSKRQPIFKRLLGKEPSDESVLADIENYLVKGHGSEESRTKLIEFKTRLAPQEAPAAEAPTAEAAPVEPTTPYGSTEFPAAEAPTAEAAPAPITETPSAPSLSTEPERVGAGVPVAGGPAAVSPAEGVGAAEPVRVVPSVEDAGRPVAGEGQQPAAVTEAPSAFGAIARGVEKVKPTYSKADEDILLSQLREVKADIKALKTAQKNLRTPQGAVLEEDREAFDEAQGQIDQLTEQQTALDNQLTALRRTKPKKEEAVPVKRTDLGINYFADPSEQFADLEREIDQAVGAYNNPRSDTKRRQVSTDYLFRLAKDGTVPEEIRTRAKEALAFAVDPRDLRDNQRDDYAALTKEIKDTGKEWEAMRYRTVPQSPVVTDRISDAELNKIVSDIEKALGGKLGITVLDDVTDVDNKQAPGSRAGALIKGQIYLFRSGIAKGIEGQKTIFHEVFHKGLRNLTSPAEYRALMTKFYNQSAAVRQAADTYLASATGKKDTKDLSPQDAQVLAVEEALAEMAEQTNLTGSTLRQLGNFFARLADRFGMPDLARAIRTMGLDPLQAFIREAIQAGVQPTVGEGVTRFREIEKVLPTRIGQFGPIKNASVRYFLRWDGTGVSAQVLDQDLVDSGVKSSKAVVEQFDLDISEDGKRAEVHTFGIPPSASATLSKYKGQFNKVKPIRYGGDSLYKFTPGSFSNKDIRYLIRNLRDIAVREKVFDKVETVVIKRATGATAGSPPREIDRETAMRFRTAPEPERPGALVGERTEATAGDAIGRTLGERKTIGLRAQATDSLAGVEAEMGYLYGGNIRDNSGNMNPTVLLSRALDAPRFSAEALDYGTLKLGDGGMIDVTELELNGQRISYGNVLRDIKAEAERRGQTPEQFVNEIGETLAGRREYELMQDEDAREQEIEYFLSPEEAQAANDKFNNDAFIKDVSAKLDAIRFSFIDLMVSTGRITKDKADAWKEMSGYVPFKRIDELDKAYVSTSGQSGNRGMKLAAFKQMKQYKGSAERQTENPIKNFVGLIDWMTAESMKAESVGRALRDLELVGAAKYLPRGRDQMPDSQKGAVVSSWQKGQQKFYYVPDPANLAAFAGAKSMEIGRIMRAAQSFSQILRVGVTITPAFALKQIADDITRAYAHSGVKNPLALTARILSNMPRNWWNEIRGTRSAGVAQLARMGVVPAYDTVQGGNVRNIFEETGISKRSTGRAILRILEAGAKASDVSVRQAIYDQTMKETGDTALAESRAREIINFSRRGAAATTDFLIRTIPFFNAYARSMDKLLLAAGGDKTVGVSTGYARNLFFKRMGVLTAMGLSYALLMSDDEEYQNLPDHVRDRNWVLPYGKELGYTPVIPLPPELSFFFKAIPERVVQYYKLQGTPEERDALRVARELMLSGVDIFWAPNLTPQLVKPFLENMMNYSFFLGRPLESQSQLRLDPSQRFGTSTSEAVKASAEALAQLGIELSPIKIENAIRGVLGMSAGVALSVADVMVNPTRTDRPLHQSLPAQLTGASAFMKDPVGTRFLDDMYDFEDKIAQAYNTYNRLVQTNPEKADAYLLENYGRYSVYQATKTVMESIRDLNKEAQIVDRAKDIPPDERRQIMNTLRAQQNELAQISYALRRQAQINQAEIDLR